MLRQVNLNSQIPHPMFIGFPNIFFNGIQGLCTQQNVHGSPSVFEKSFINYS